VRHRLPRDPLAPRRYKEMIVYEEIRLAGRDRWQGLIDEAAQVRLARQNQSKTPVRPRLARGLVALARRIDPATAPVRQTRPA